LIPNSQVFITGRGSDGTKYLGLLGVAISRSQNESVVGTATESLRLSFSADLARILKDRIASRSLSARFGVIDTPDGAQTILHPSAKLTVSDDDSARLSFRLTARFTDAITNSDVKKEYYYFHGGYKPIPSLSSWSEDNAKPIKAVAGEALAVLSDALIDDIGGSYSSAFDQDKQHFVTYTVVGFPGRVARALLLHDYSDHIAIAPLIKDRPNKNFVIILERKSIVLQGS
jgi:hypothetical protein